jgi:hypothetical protein
VTVGAGASICPRGDALLCIFIVANSPFMFVISRVPRAGLNV